MESLVDELKRRIAFFVAWRAHEALRAGQPERAIILARRAVRWLPQGIGYYPYVLEIEALLKLGDLAKALQAKSFFDQLLQSQTRYNVDTAMYLALHTARLFESSAIRHAPYMFWDVVPSDVVVEKVDRLVREVFPAQLRITPQ